MTGAGDYSTSSVAELKQGYRAIRAPDFLATRIRAEMNSRAMRRNIRRPLFAAVALAVCVLALLPFINRQETPRQSVPVSLATLSMGISATPLPLMPSMAHLKSVRPPVLPARPVLKKTDKYRNDSDVHLRHESPKEKTHEIT